MPAHQLVTIFQPRPDPRMPEPSERDTEDSFSFYASDDLAELQRFRPGVEGFLLMQAMAGVIGRFIVFIAPGAWKLGDPVNLYYGSGRAGIDPLVP